VVPTRIRSTVGLLALLASIATAGCSSGNASGSEEASVSSSASAAPEREYDFSAVVPVIEAFIAQHGLNGAGLVVVDEDEGVIDEQYFGEFSADRTSLVASASKMVTAGVLVRLADEGLLDLDEPIANYVDWAEGHNPEITVAQLLSSSSGLVGLGPNPGYLPYVCQFSPAAELEECAASAWATPGDDADVVAPDTEFRYGGVQWQIAGAVAETVSGKSWSELLEETYVEPCGVESMGYSNHWTVLGSGGFAYPTGFDGDVDLLPETENPHMEGGLYIEPLDYADLLLMHLRDGRCGDTQVLEPESVERMHTDRIGEAYAGAAMPGSGYGLGWWVPRDGSGRINDPGAYGAVPWLDLDGGFGAYLVLESNAVLGIQLASQLYQPVEDAITAAR
jgi:CubicO group peptidase (beta-lactamase class C family)